MKKIDEINTSISKGISFLEEHQFPNGEFCCYVSNNDEIQMHPGTIPAWCIRDDIVFPTALICNSLTFLNDYPGVNDLLTKGTNFLLNQMKTGGVWNHFTQNHSLYNICPSDLDDTACVSALLNSRGIVFPSNLDLIKNNIDKENLFFTWVTLRFRLNSSKSYWKLSLAELRHPIKTFFFWKKMSCTRNDVDAVVNANILYYLGETENTQSTINYLLQVISDEKEHDCDKWYRNVFTIYYFISRNFYKGITKLEPVRNPIIARIIAKLKPDGCIGNSVLDSALAVCTLLNFKYKGPKLENVINFILCEQYETGDWERRCYYYDGPKKIAGFGSEELTTSVCLEALNRYKEQLQAM